MPASQTRRSATVQRTLGPSLTLFPVTTGELISRTCTTSWSDWSHGDLYLTPEALIRIRLPQPTPEAMRFRNTVGPRLQHRELPPANEADRVLAADPTNRYILLADVRAARLHYGILSDRLALTMGEGVSLKLLWLRFDPALTVLQRELPARVGTAFSLD